MAWPEKSGAHSWRVRYRRDDGTIGSIPGFTSHAAAAAHAADIDTDQRRGTWIDPAASKTILADWLAQWIDAIDVDTRTEENYRSILRRHIEPKWGSVALCDVSNLAAQAWAKKLRASGLSPVTVSGIMKLLTMILADAADERLIAANPIRTRHRGRRRRTTRPAQKVWPEPSEALAVADQMATYYHPDSALLLVTAAWTGARWGELVGLQAVNVHLFDDDTGHIVIDPDIGALHEASGGNLWLGPPKTEESARTITLPPFLVRLLRTHLAGRSHQFVFTTPHGDFHRRSNFSRRAMRPAADGTPTNNHTRAPLQPIKPGLSFHGCRHGHKTWMITDGIPEIAQSLRLGHILPDKIQQTYSHVAAEVEQRLLHALQTRWEKAVASMPSDADATWRAEVCQGSWTGP